MVNITSIFGYKDIFISSNQFLYELSQRNRDRFYYDVNGHFSLLSNDDFWLLENYNQTTKERVIIEYPIKVYDTNKLGSPQILDFSILNVVFVNLLYKICKFNQVNLDNINFGKIELQDIKNEFDRLPEDKLFFYTPEQILPLRVFYNRHFNVNWTEFDSIFRIRDNIELVLLINLTFNSSKLINLTGEENTIVLSKLEKGSSLSEKFVGCLTDIVGDYGFNLRFVNTQSNLTLQCPVFVISLYNPLHNNLLNVLLDLAQLLASVVEKLV